jgi:hypothetical protein
LRYHCLDGGVARETDDVKSGAGRKCAQQQYLYEFDIARSVVTGLTGYRADSPPVSEFQDSL